MNAVKTLLDEVVDTATSTDDEHLANPAVKFRDHCQLTGKHISTKTLFEKENPLQIALAYSWEEVFRIGEDFNHLANTRCQYNGITNCKFF